ncbi:DUF3332 domain-containing protein [Alcanivorax sp. S6407]|uniref:DUF3332 family protein n=1 Tax=Alcanivorax sp. S6407 TaxID=2926424 RepID=UPI001FF6BF6B|nr:DUF3332 family protein [Alcanivorax sp. S6407]MCK0153131.1 DUF3332 domain-containing protein [Alcanivorax sp. S6407]
MKKAFTSAACAMMLTGCLGQNALFDTVQDWNADATNNKFVNQGISFVFWWLPVYGLTLLGDIVIFNSIEFWTGTNPLSKEGAKVAGTTETVDDGMGNQAELTYNADGSISVLATSEGVQERYTLVKEGDKVIKIQDEQREVLGSMLL